MQSKQGWCIDHTFGSPHMPMLAFPDDLYLLGRMKAGIEDVVRDLLLAFEYAASEMHPVMQHSRHFGRRMAHPDGSRFLQCLDGRRLSGPCRSPRASSRGCTAVGRLPSIFSPWTFKRLRALETAFAYQRHATPQLLHSFIEGLQHELAGDRSSSARRDSSARRRLSRRGCTSSLRDSRVLALSVLG